MVKVPSELCHLQVTVCQYAAKFNNPGVNGGFLPTGILKAGVSILLSTLFLPEWR